LPTPTNVLSATGEERDHGGREADPAGDHRARASCRGRAASIGPSRIRRAGPPVVQSERFKASMEPMTRRLVADPCQDASGTVNTGQLPDGAPIYRCPGCASELVETPGGPPATLNQEIKRSPT
jgi:hypothetical protein